MTELSDLLLAQRAASGDVVAFEALVRRHQLRIFRLCHYMLDDEHAAQDATQDVFLTAWRSIGRYRGDARFSSWLYRIATNRCLRELGRRQPHAAVPDLPATDGNPDAELEASERLASVTAAVGQLPDEQRAALLLREVEGLPYSDIAEILGLTMSAVKSRIYRARLDLARKLDTL